MELKPHFLKISSFCLIGSASAAAIADGVADSLSISLFTAAFAASCLFNTAWLRRLLPARFFVFAVIVYICFIPIDFFLLSSDWPRLLLHAIWFALAVKMLTRSNDNDWPPLYLLGSVQWILAAAQPTGTIFWVSFAVFIASGITALMLFELRRPLKIADVKENPDESGTTFSSGFQYRPFLTAVTGVTAAVTALAIPLFFFFPRLPVKSGAPTSSDTTSSFTDSIEDGETIELGREYSQQQPDAIVMRVKTDVTEENLPYNLKWRGAAFDHYDGRAWTLRRREQLPVTTQGGFYKLEESAMGSEFLRQTFFMEETLTNKIFAAHRALAVSIDAGFLRRDSSDNLSAQNPAQGKKSYIVVSDSIYPDVGKITDWTPIPDDIRSTWLQLPESDPRIAQLALEITGRYRRQYDKALALEIWLRSRYGYTETLPQINMANGSGDPLAAFLFDAREGHCEYFATAMTVMLRSIGIPARIVSGFLAGEYNPIGGSWTVRRKHSHTWTEAWFPPYGWVEFDATPMDEFSVKPTFARFFANFADAAGLWWRQNVTDYDAARQYGIINGFFDRVNRTEDRVVTFLSSSANRARAAFNLSRQTKTHIKITAFIVLFIAVLWILVLRRIRRRFPSRRVFRRSAQNPQTAAAGFYLEALLFLKAKGFIPEKSQTPLEFAQSFNTGSHESSERVRMIHGDSAAAIALFELTRFYNEIRFGGSVVPFPYDEARALLRSLKAAFESPSPDIS